MRKFFLMFLFLTGAVSFAATVECRAPRNNPNAFLSDTYVRLQLSGQELRFQQYSIIGKSLMRDYLYSFSKVMAGNSKVKNMQEFVLQKEIKSFGDALRTVYLDQAISQGKGGTLIFNGQGFSWDWNYCRAL